VFSQVGRRADRVLELHHFENVYVSEAPHAPFRYQFEPGAIQLFDVKLVRAFRDGRQQEGKLNLNVLRLCALVSFLLVAFDHSLVAKLMLHQREQRLSFLDQPIAGVVNHLLALRKTSRNLLVMISLCGGGCNIVLLQAAVHRFLVAFLEHADRV
jgi:hypothetical protein